MPKLSNYFNVLCEIETFPECSTESETDINVPQASLSQDVTLPEEDSNGGCTDINEPRVSPP